MPSLDPYIVILSKYFGREQVHKSLKTDWYVEKESKNEKRNKPLSSGSAIQIDAYAYFKKGCKIPDEVIERNWYRKPEQTYHPRRCPRRLVKKQQCADHECK